MDTHEDDLVVEDHCSVSSVDKGTGIEVTLFGKQGAFFQDRSDIPSPLSNLMLTSRQVAVDKTQGRVVDDESTDDSTLVGRKIKSMEAKIFLPYSQNCLSYRV